MSAHVAATCVTQRVHERTRTDDAPSGIDKASVEHVELTPTGVVGDKVLDTDHHGGIDKAAYAYAGEDAAWWADRLDQDVPPGRFGENLRTSGLDLRDAVIGSRWTIGATAVVEVSEPRVPCSTFQHHMGDRSGWVKDFMAAGRTGTYLRVLQPGVVTAGDPVEVTHVPAHGVRALLAAEDADWRLPSALRDYVEWVLQRAG